MAEIIHKFYSNYLISDKGYVRSKLTTKILKPYKGHVYLRKEGQTYDVWVDQLVADCFLKQPSSNHVIYHLDKNRENSKLSNIMYVDENMLLDMQKSDDWKDISGYEGIYQITKYGDIRSLDRIVSCRVKQKSLKMMQYGCKISTSQGKDGYEHVSLSKNGKPSLFSVHRLVANTYLPNPENLPQVNHIDCNKQNNDVSNLEWCTQSHNMKHAHESGLWSPKQCGVASAIKCGTRILCVTTGDSFLSINSAAKYFNMDYNSVKESADLHRPRKGYQFEYIK